MSDVKDISKTEPEIVIPEGIELSDGLEIKNREQIKEDMLKAGVPENEIEETINSAMKSFFASRIDLDFVGNDSLMGILRNIKSIVEKQISGKTFFSIDPAYMEIMDELDKVYKD